MTEPEYLEGDTMTENIDTAEIREQRLPIWPAATVLALCDEVDRLRLGVDYTDEGAEIVLRQLTDARRERDEARAALLAHAVEMDTCASAFESSRAEEKAYRWAAMDARKRAGAIEAP